MSELVLHGSVYARAHVNIALVKYWGKAAGGGRTAEASAEGEASAVDVRANLPAVPSLSLTLDDLYTETTARFAPHRDDDRLVLDGEELTGDALGRARVIFDRVRELADVAAPFDVTSTNRVPTAAGLASSASGMAALAAATARCAGLSLEAGPLSALARLGSGSASRSIHGGWVAWDGPEARPLAPVGHWDVALVVAVVGRAPKAVGSREGMNRTAATSPYYPAWVHQARELFDEAADAVARRDLPALAEAMEVSTLRMHASALAARPPVRYIRAASLAAVEAVEALRDEEGLKVGWTMDAGPNVKVLCEAPEAARVASRLAEVAGVVDTLVARPGPEVAVRVEEGIPESGGAEA